MVGNAVKLGKIPILKWLKVDDVKIPEFRLHSRFENDSDFEKSIKADGVIQPIYVFEDENGVYWLADGQNRLEALKKQPDKPMIQAYVMHGSIEDALLFSAKLNVLRGKVNVGELAEFIYNLQRLTNWGVEKLAEKIGLSKGYVSKLLAVAENKEIVENLKKGSISIEEAYKSSKSFVAKPVSQETRYEEKPSFTPMKKEACEQSEEGLTNEDLGLTSSLKEAMEEGKRFKPLGPDEEEEERRGRCAYCGGYFTSKSEITFIAVHKKECKRKVWDLIIQAERESQTDSSQP
ncbi:MAG: ParB N-terminal domain-containing protein [Candidatus Bathyarchaeia archaeon]